ncbi:MAG: hypothetical protein IPG91_23710 [Ideonella sp.]|nr:hypothetical protein [Ideonella sp.]
MEVDRDANDPISDPWRRARHGQGLHKAGVMDQLTLRDFDQRCMPPVEPRRANNLVPNTKCQAD